LPGVGTGWPAPGQVNSRHFGDRLAAAVAARESQIVLGIDPDPGRLWPAAALTARLDEARARLAPMRPDAEARDTDAAVGTIAAGTAAAGAEPLVGAASARGHAETPIAARLDAAAAVLAHCLALIDAAGSACVAVKPQLACFERLGAPGWLALEHVCAHARAEGLLVLADGKRGDVPVTAAVYAQALVGTTPSPFGPLPGLEADAFTANPLLGRDALEPLVAGARAHGAGPFVLVRTSNPGAADLLDLELATGERLWERLAVLVAELGRPGAAGLADVGAVTGATEPQHLERLRALMPATPFLLPGIGAQGGDVRTIAPAFAPGRAGGLVTASRAIANAYETAGGTPADAALVAAEGLREQAWALA
jgi:orotidine-5'-phosphate decarboxylase